MALCAAKSGSSSLTPPVVLGPVRHTRRRATGPIQNQTPPPPPAPPPTKAFPWSLEPAGSPFCRIMPWGLQIQV